MTLTAAELDEIEARHSDDIKAAAELVRVRCFVEYITQHVEVDGAMYNAATRLRDTADANKRLVAEVRRLQDEVARWENEAERLRQFSSRQHEEIETLNSYADAVEVLRDIGNVIGCGHIDDPDGRRQLVNCVEQEWQRMESDLSQLRAENERLRGVVHQIDATLRVPAAEYVPAISDVFQIIDANGLRGDQ